MSPPPGRGRRRGASFGEPPAPLLRAAQVLDAAPVARVFVDCWKEGYHGILPTAWVAALSYEEQTENWRRVISLPGNATLVATTPAGEVIAFLCGGPERSARSFFFAEVYGLYVLPDWRGRGIGRHLLAGFGAQLLRAGLRSMVARVAEANPIRGFYEAMGGVEHDVTPVRVAGRSLNEVSYGWRDIRPLSRELPSGNPT